jgi:hypothetical protein
MLYINSGGIHPEVVITFGKSVSGRSLVTVLEYTVWIGDLPYDRFSEQSGELWILTTNKMIITFRFQPISVDCMRHTHISYLFAVGHNDLLEFYFRRKKIQCNHGLE